MNEEARQPKLREPLSPVAFYGIASALTFLAYACALWSISGWSIGGVVLDSVRNVLAIGVACGIAIPLLQRYVVRLPRWHGLAVHVAAALPFALLVYWLLMVLLGLSRGEGLTSFRVEPFFDNPAYAWQLLQGLTVYSLVAALTQLRVQPELPQFVLPAGAPDEATADAGPGISRYFIRDGDDLHPVDVSRIVTITGADDYSEVATLAGRHLVRMTLASFEEALDPRRFIRVHRSRIVNIDQIGRAEPAGGGRMLLHMENGETVQASRNGSRLLRERVI